MNRSTKAGAMAGGLGRKRYGVIHELPRALTPVLRLGCQTRANPGFSPDGTQLGIVLLSF